MRHRAPAIERVWERTDKLKANKGAPEGGRARLAAGEQNHRRERESTRGETERESMKEGLEREGDQRVRETVEEREHPEQLIFFIKKECFNLDHKINN